MSRNIIGLAGFRKTGKSLITKHLCENHGFRSVHPFEVWKDGIKAMFVSIGIEEDIAERMVRGDLKDTPHPLLPEDQDARYLMERSGKFAGTVLGPDWTLGLALRKTELEYPDDDLVIESIVYEVDVVRGFNGHICMVDRPETEGSGLETDEATKLIVPDSHFVNAGHDPRVLTRDFDEHLRSIGMLRGEEILEPS